MNQGDIETFLMLVKTKNITKTAENLFVSQPTVSHRLKQLETELKVPLLIRKKGYKKIELTPKGEEFVAIAERWLALMNETMMLQSHNESILLSIGCTETLNTTIFLDLYPRILANKDLNLSLKLTTQYSYSVYENLENYLVDVGFVYQNLPFKNINSEPILRERMYLVQEESQAVRAPRVALHELDPAGEIYFDWETNYSIWHGQVIPNRNLHSVEVDTYCLLAAMLRKPGSWAIAPYSVARQLQREQNAYVCELGERKAPPERITYMITHWNMSEAKKRAVTLFHDEMVRYLIEEGYARGRFPETAKEAAESMDDDEDK